MNEVERLREALIPLYKYVRDNVDLDAVDSRTGEAVNLAQELLALVPAPPESRDTATAQALTREDIDRLPEQFRSAVLETWQEYNAGKRHGPVRYRLILDLAAAVVAAGGAAGATTAAQAEDAK